MVNAPFSIYISSEFLPVDGKDVQLYFVSTKSLVAQLMEDLIMEERAKLSMLTPLSLFESVTGKSELELYAELCKHVNKGRFVTEYLHEQNMSDIMLTFKDKNAAAEMVRIIALNLDKSQYMFTEAR